MARRRLAPALTPQRPEKEAKDGDGQHKLSRRTLLGAVCASTVIPAQAGTSGRPAPSPSPGGPGFRRDDGSCAVTTWDRALARFRSAQAEVDAATGEPDQRRYDALVDRADERMSALLALPAPDPAGMAVKLDIILPHRAWELTGSEDCLERLRQDAHRIAAAAA